MRSNTLRPLVLSSQTCTIPTSSHKLIAWPSHHQRQSARFASSFSIWRGTRPPWIIESKSTRHPSRESIPPVDGSIRKTCMMVVCRLSSSSSKGSRFKLDALPFKVSPEDALQKFRDWAEVDQGLKYLMNYDSVRIGAAYVPVYSFDLNLRFGTNWKPPLFSIYQGFTMHIPGLSAYAGYSYRRSLINPVHSTSLVFLGEETQPFGGWMLKDMVLRETGASITVIPDAWNASKARL